MNSQDDIDYNNEEEDQNEDKAQSKTMTDVDWEGVIDETMTGLDCSDADMVPVYKSTP